MSAYSLVSKDPVAVVYSITQQFALTLQNTVKKYNYSADKSNQLWHTN